MTQTILGSGGAIGKELAKALEINTVPVRLVSRHPKKINPTDELVSADLLDPEATRHAVEGSSVAYLTVGLPYRLSVWRQYWPRVMQNVIDGCVATGCKLVFFDNIYMYDKSRLDGMDESTPVNPPSKKGAIRKQIAEMLMDAVDAGKLEGLIARSADFYGPSISGTSILTEMVFKNLHQGKKAFWMSSVDKKHSFTYTPDAGKATALLGQTDDAYGQVWHLPTASDPPTGKEWIDRIAQALDAKPRHQVVSRFMIRLIGFFQPTMREMVEMLYQYDRDYVFNSRKFEKRFNFAPTSYEEGIRKIVETDYTSEHD